MRGMMINKSKLAFVVAIALTSIALPAFAQTSTTAVHRHHYAHRRPVQDNSLGARAYGSIPGPAPSDPADDPAMTGGGNMGFNACAGHARC